MENKPLNLLIVEEGKENTRLIKGLTEDNSDFSIKITNIARFSDISELQNKNDFDLLILDPEIGSKGGLNLFYHFINNVPALPVIVIVSSKEKPLGLKAVGLGAQDFLIREEITPSVLLHSIESSIVRHKYSGSLRSLQEELRLTTKHSKVVLSKQNTDLVYTWVHSPSTSINTESIIGKKDADFLPQEDALILTELKKRVLETGIETSKIIRTTINDKLRFFDLFIEPYYDQSGQIEGIKCASWDITDRKQAEREYLKAKNLLERIFTSLDEAVFVYELESRKIITSNPGVQKIFGYSAQEIVGKTTELLHIDHEHFERYRKISQSFLLKRGFFQAEYQMKRKDGKIITTEHKITLLKKNKGWDDIIVGVVNDITERKQIEIAMIKAKENAEKSDHLKSEFLAQMSHEIRTPVNIVLSYTNLLKDEIADKVPDDLKSGFKAIDRAGKRIIRTVDLILNMSEMLTGNYELIKRKIDIYLDLLLKLYIEFRKAASDKDIELTITKTTDNTEILADEYSLTQIFSNLIDNAIKYTRNGKIELRIARDKENRLFVDIEDTGIGMSQEYMGRIFKPFTQEQQGYTRLFEGNGLGLALVKKYVELNNASIEVDSKKGEGTKFSIVFNHSIEEFEEL